MSKTKITDEEKKLLKEYAKRTPLILVRLKSEAVLLSSKAMSNEDIADVLDRSVYTVTLWLRAWRKKRLSSIFTGHQHNNNAGKLTPKQREEVRAVLQSPPSDIGLPKEFWDLPQLKTYVEASFGVIYESDQAYHYLMRFSNLSFKYPDTFDRRRNDEFIIERMKQIKSETKPLFHDDRWDIFTVDEVRMEQEALTRKAWLKRGERTVIKVNRDKEHQSYIGFLNQKTYSCDLFEMDWQNQTEVLKAFEQLLTKYPDKLICIIWDNAPFHKGKEIREALKKGNLLEKVHLIPMPPYAPDHNPTEHVWNTAKQHISNIQHKTFEETKRAFSDFVTNRSFRYSI